jgi:hypothetical protein
MVGFSALILEIVHPKVCEQGKTSSLRGVIPSYQLPGKERTLADSS